MNRAYCLIAALALATALPAAAQQPPLPGQMRIRMDRPYMAVMPGGQAEYETLLDSSSGNNIGPQPLARIDLANRISTLIELGRCDEARALANEAGERGMALRARQLCRSRRAGLN